MTVSIVAAGNSPASMYYYAIDKNAICDLLPLPCFERSPPIIHLSHDEVGPLVILYHISEIEISNFRMVRTMHTCIQRQQAKR